MVQRKVAASSKKAPKETWVYAMPHDDYFGSTYPSYEAAYKSAVEELKEDPENWADAKGQTKVQFFQLLKEVKFKSELKAIAVKVEKKRVFVGEVT